jgi:hypothetical protein
MCRVLIDNAAVESAGSDGCGNRRYIVSDVSAHDDKIAFDAVQLRDRGKQTPTRESDLPEELQARCVMAKDAADQRVDA